ncbi:MAG: STAS domain-containing protein [Candidatus Omnitrophota bacterium]
MPIKVESKNGMTVCQVTGEVDINTSPDIKKTFDKLIAKKELKIVVNFSKVTYVDSSGLATLVEILKNMRAYGGKIRLSNLSSKVKSLFEITKLDKLFDIKADENEAVSNFV